MKWDKTWCLCCLHWFAQNKYLWAVYRNGTVVFPWRRATNMTHSLTAHLRTKGTIGIQLNLWKKENIFIEYFSSAGVKFSRIEKGVFDLHAHWSLRRTVIIICWCNSQVSQMNETIGFYRCAHYSSLTE